MNRFEWLGWLVTYIMWLAIFYVAFDAPSWAATGIGLILAELAILKHRSDPDGQ